MGILFQNTLDPKYQLLDENKSRLKCATHSWALFGFITLLISIAIITIILVWDQIIRVEHESEELDFVLFGPKKETSDAIRTSEYRALMYAMDQNMSMGVTFPAYSEKKFLSFAHVEKKNPYSLVCYYSVPSRSSISNRLYPNNMDAHLCTHVIAFFSTIHNNTISLPSEHESQIFRDLTALKQNNTNLKVLLSIMALSTSDDAFGIMVSSQENRKVFISSALRIMKMFSFDGLDLDWEFPAWPLNKDPNQKEQFVSLLEEMRLAFSKDYLISVAVAAPITIVRRSYDVKKIAQYVDFVNIMCYDYHTFVWYLPLVGPNAPLYKSNREIGYFGTLNVNYTIFYWLQAGMPKEKIMVGMPTYGHSWTLEFPEQHSFGAIAKGFGSLGNKGFINRRDICSFTALPDTVVVFDGETAVPYAYRNSDWISYDNEKSLSYKAELVTEMGLAGAMIFSLNTDDYDNSVCQSGSFPLVRQVKRVLEDDNL